MRAASFRANFWQAVRSRPDRGRIRVRRLWPWLPGVRGGGRAGTQGTSHSLQPWRAQITSAASRVVAPDRFTARTCSASATTGSVVSSKARRIRASGSHGSSGASVAVTAMPASRRARMVRQRSSIGAQCGSKTRRTSSRSVVTEKLTRSAVFSARVCRRARSRRISGPRVWIVKTRGGYAMTASRSAGMVRACSSAGW